MALEPIENETPSEVSEAARLARELFAKINPQETPEVIDPPDEPAIETPASVEEPAHEPETNWEQKYKVLQGKYDKEVPTMASDLREMKQYLASLQTAPKTVEPPVVDERKAEREAIVAKLSETYPQDLIDSFIALQRLEAEDVASKFIKPVEQKTASLEDAQLDAATSNYVTFLDQKSTNWKPVWQVATELMGGKEPSDPSIAAFLQSPDPSGLYTNLELIKAYDDKWDAERFTTLCNMYEVPASTPPPRNVHKEALIAPSRVRTQPTPQGDEVKIWTMTEFKQFQSDAREGKYDEATQEAMWADVKKAVAENRMRP